MVYVIRTGYLILGSGQKCQEGLCTENKVLRLVDPSKVQCLAHGEQSMYPFVELGQMVDATTKYQVPVVFVHVHIHVSQNITVYSLVNLVCIIFASLLIKNNQI